MPQHVITEILGPIARICLNRPEARNALVGPMIGELSSALSGAAKNPSVRVLVLTGSGASFCAGIDLKWATTVMDDRKQLEQVIDNLQGLVRQIVDAPKPVIAAVDGPAVGFGADLAFACDLRVLSERAVLQEKFVQIGLMPDGGGSFWLTRLVGLGRGLELLLRGSPVYALQAVQLGLAQQVALPEELDRATLAVAHDLSQGPPLALEAIKRAAWAPHRAELEQALLRERDGQLRLLGTEDLREGVQAWLEQRPAQFKGR